MADEMERAKPAGSAREAVDAVIEQSGRVAMRRKERDELAILQARELKDAEQAVAELAKRHNRKLDEMEAAIKAEEGALREMQEKLAANYGMKLDFLASVHGGRSTRL